MLSAEARRPGPPAVCVTCASGTALQKTKALDKKRGGGKGGGSTHKHKQTHTRKTRTNNARFDRKLSPTPKNKKKHNQQGPGGTPPLPGATIRNRAVGSIPHLLLIAPQNRGTAITLPAHTPSRDLPPPVKNSGGASPRPPSIYYLSTTGYNFFLLG